MFLTKYSANGNDFLITTALKRANRASIAQKLCDRHNGIGADGFVVLLPHNKFAYQWEFYNADGSKANMCGNASRCVAHYAYNNKIAPKNHIFLSDAGKIKVCVTKNEVEVNLGKVKILRENLPESFGKSHFNFILLDSGVPHLVAFIPNLADFIHTKDLTQNSQKASHNLAQNLTFLKNLREKYNANVNLAFIASKDTIELLTYERGVENITLACGTGMCAVYYLAKMQNLINDKATLIPPSGDRIALRLENDEVCFKGTVQKIADIVL